MMIIIIQNQVHRAVVAHHELPGTGGFDLAVRLAANIVVVHCLCVIVLLICVHLAAINLRRTIRAPIQVRLSLAVALAGETLALR